MSWYVLYVFFNQMWIMVTVSFCYQCVMCMIVIVPLCYSTCMFDSQCSLVLLHVYNSIQKYFTYNLCMMVPPVATVWDNMTVSDWSFTIYNCTTGEKLGVLQPPVRVFYLVLVLCSFVSSVYCNLVLLSDNPVRICIHVVVVDIIKNQTELLK